MGEKPPGVKDYFDYLPKDYKPTKTTIELSQTAFFFFFYTEWGQWGQDVNDKIIVNNLHDC